MLLALHMKQVKIMLSFQFFSVGKMNGQMYACMPHTSNTVMHMTSGD